MDDIIDREGDSEETSLARCRELLGDEAAALSDEQLDAIRQHAQAMAMSWSNCSARLVLKAEPHV